MLAGVAFLAVGVLGFLPGVTTDLDDLAVTGPDSRAQLFGVFGVSVVHNVVHLSFGVLGVAVARAPKPATAYLVWGGVAYLALWVYGLVVDHDGDTNVLALDAADNWLHLGLGTGLLVLGLLGRRLWRGTLAENL